MASLKGYLLLGSAFVFCPCHLALAAALLAGTAVGGFLTQHMLLAAAGAVYVVGAFALGVRLVGGRTDGPADGTCPACDTAALGPPVTAQGPEAVRA